MSSEPFKQENLINLLLRKAGVDTLKNLRKVDEKWLYLDNKELEKRSKKGQFKTVEFSEEHFQEDLQLFLEETEANPELFKSFRFEFRDAFKFLDASFFTLYRPQFLQIEFPDEFTFTQEAAQYLGNLLGWISEDIQELQILNHISFKNVRDRVPAVFQAPLVFPNLTKFSYRHDLEFNNIPIIKYFHCILDRSRDVDPAPNLTFLEIEPRWCRKSLKFLFGSNPTTPIAISRWSKLTHLSLDSILQRVSSMLSSLASGGMSLESLSLFCETYPLDFDFVAVCSDLSTFFHTQAKSLKILKLAFSDEVVVGLNREGETYGRIYWPIFENVHTLKLLYPFFDMGPIPVHFPWVRNLEIGAMFDFKAMYPDEIQPSSIPNLSIEYAQLSNNNDERIDWVESKFQSVVHFKCDIDMVKIGQRELPWSETLQVLEINYVDCPIQVGYLKGLKKLAIHNHDGLEYLKTAWFEEALDLNLSSITFKDFSNDMPSNELKQAFSEYFPYPVEFQQIQEFE